MPMSHLSAVAGPPSHSAAYDLVLLAHLLSALVGFGAVVVSGAFAVVLARSGPESEALSRYYRPGVNWAGRVLFLVPVFGAILVLISKGAWSFSDRWVAIGLVLWVVVAFGAEMALWPTILATPGLIPHLYGKAEARPGRKMGHVTRLFPRGALPGEFGVAAALGVLAAEE